MASSLPPLEALLPPSTSGGGHTFLFSKRDCLFNPLSKGLPTLPSAFFSPEPSDHRLLPKGDLSPVQSPLQLDWSVSGNAPPFLLNRNSFMVLCLCHHQLLPENFSLSTWVSALGYFVKPYIFFSLHRPLEQLVPFRGFRSECAREFVATERQFFSGESNPLMKFHFSTLTSRSPGLPLYAFLVPEWKKSPTIEPNAET